MHGGSALTAQPSILNLIVEVTGARDKEKAAKVAAARNLWIPAVNNHGGFGRWAFVEIADPWDAKRALMLSLDACQRLAQGV